MTTVVIDELTLSTGIRFRPSVVVNVVDAVVIFLTVLIPVLVINAPLVVTDTLAQTDVIINPGTRFVESLHHVTVADHLVKVLLMVVELHLHT